MKIKHNVPTTIRSAQLTPEYQAEVDRTMERAAAQYEQEQKRLDAAERRRERLAQKASKRQTAAQARITSRQLREIDEFIELQRAHLQRLYGLMKSSPNPVSNRGRKSYRPVPNPGELI